VRLVPRSLFGRLFASSLVATLAALALAGVAIGGVMQRFVTAGIDGRLSDRLAALESAVRTDGTLDRAQLARVTARIDDDEPWRIDLPGGGAAGAAGLRIDIDRPHPPPHPGRGPHERFGEPFEGLQAGGRVHGLTAPVETGAGPVRVSVAVPRREIDRPVLAALMPLAGSLAILGLALGGAALVQLKLGLRPLRDLQASVEAIRRGERAPLPERLPEELAPLALELDALASETASALAGARRSAANLAHALKTPVATLALQLRDDAAAQAQLARIDATLRHHLGHARAAAANRRVETVLGPALADLADAVGAIHQHCVAIGVEVPAGLSAAIGTQDLDELAGNLIDNAARHARSRVTVSAAADGRLVRLTVADDGPGIPAADRARAAAPGNRLDERGDGHGFGLSIAREIAELHGGALTLGDAPGGGLLAAVTLRRTG
jgi:signal transduction histidine kinase